MNYENSRGRGRGKMRGGRSDRRAPEPGNGGCEDDLDANREAEVNDQLFMLLLSRLRQVGI